MTIAIKSCITFIVILFYNRNIYTYIYPIPIITRISFARTYASLEILFVFATRLWQDIKFNTRAPRAFLYIIKQCCGFRYHGTKLFCARAFHGVSFDVD